MLTFKTTKAKFRSFICLIIAHLIDIDTSSEFLYQRINIWENSNMTSLECYCYRSGVSRPFWSHVIRFCLSRDSQLTIADVNETMADLLSRLSVPECTRVSNFYIVTVGREYLCGFFFFPKHNVTIFPVYRNWRCLFTVKSLVLHHIFVPQVQ